MQRSSLTGLMAVALAVAVAACGSVSSGASDAGAGGGGASGGAGGQGQGGAGGFAGRVPSKHRAAAMACPTDQPTGSCNPTDPSIPDGGLMCRTDADCTAGAKGRCVGSGSAVATTSASRGPALPGCSCAYDACTADSDCATGGPCACRPGGQAIVAPSPAATNVCLQGNCHVDGDCGAGGSCSPSFGSCGAYGGVVGYYCHTPRDTCVDDGDCQVRGGTGDCRFSPASSAWACSTTQCVG